MVISLNFLSWWSLVLFPSTNKSYEKKLNIWLFTLQVIFDQVTNIRKTWTWEICFVGWILEIWTWNLRGYISHVVDKKSLSIAPWRRNEERRGLSCLLSHRKQKESHREVNKAKEAAIRCKRGKGEAWMLKLGEVC